MPILRRVNRTTTEIGESFARDGFYLARAVFSAEEIGGLEIEFDRIVAQLQDSGENINARWGGHEMDRLGASGTAVVHTHNVQHYSAAWLRALQQPRFLDIAETILGPDIVLHHTKLFQKPAERGSPFPMHQDWSYFPTKNDTMIAAVIHVSAASDEMGCLRVYPGTHKLGRLERTGGTESSEVLHDYPMERAAVLEARAGDVLFFHYCLMHGSMPNVSSLVRKTVLVQMHAGNDEVEAGCGHPNEQLVLRGWNHAARRSTSDTVKV